MVFRLQNNRICFGSHFLVCTFYYGENFRSFSENFLSIYGVLKSYMIANLFYQWKKNVNLLYINMHKSALKCYWHLCSQNLSQQRLPEPPMFHLCLSWKRDKLYFLPQGLMAIKENFPGFLILHKPLMYCLYQCIPLSFLQIWPSKMLIQVLFIYYLIQLVKLGRSVKIQDSSTSWSTNEGQKKYWLTLGLGSVISKNSWELYVLR